jgi:hypothetical protein
LRIKNKCLSCAECYKLDFGNICPNIYCPKMLLNGPCGGYVLGKCEVDLSQKCAWIEICAVLYTQDKLAGITPYRWPRPALKGEVGCL